MMGVQPFGKLDLRAIPPAAIRVIAPMTFARLS
jgi:hypothetical protein